MQNILEWTEVILKLNDVWMTSYHHYRWRRCWSLHLYTHLCVYNSEMRASKKKIQAWMGFEPINSAILVECFTNWAQLYQVKLKLVTLRIHHRLWRMQINIWNTIYLNCGERYEDSWSSQLYTQFKQLWNIHVSLKKIQAWIDHSWMEKHYEIVQLLLPSVNQ